MKTLHKIMNICFLSNALLCYSTTTNIYPKGVKCECGREVLSTHTRFHVKEKDIVQIGDKIASNRTCSFSCYRKNYKNIYKR